MKYIDDRWRYTAIAGGILIFLSSLVLGLMEGRYSFSARFVVPAGNSTRLMSHTPWTLFNRPWLLPAGPSASLSDTVMGIGLLIAMIPVAYVALNNHKYVKSVEANIPRFLRDLLQATDSGLILPKALTEAAKADYGPISKEIGIAMTKFSLGYDFRASVMEAARKLRHPSAPQVGLILAEAYSSGGKMHDVLSSSVKLFNGLEDYSEEKQSELRPYTQLVYISVGIFLVICLIIISQFITPLQKLPVSPSQSNLLSGASSRAFSGLTRIPASYFESIFFVTALFESFFGGIVAGKIVDGSAQAGLKHSLFLILATILVFNVPVIGIFNAV